MSLVFIFNAGVLFALADWYIGERKKHKKIKEG